MKNGFSSDVQCLVGREFECPTCGEHVLCLFPFDIINHQRTIRNGEPGWKIECPGTKKFIIFEVKHRVFIPDKIKEEPKT